MKKGGFYLGHILGGSWPWCSSVSGEGSVSWGRAALERNGLHSESAGETGGAQPCFFFFSSSFSHRTEITPERSNPFHRMSIDLSIKVGKTQSPSSPYLFRTYEFSELLCWGPSFFKIPNGFIGNKALVNHSRGLYLTQPREWGGSRHLHTWDWCWRSLCLALVEHKCWSQTGLEKHFKRVGTSVAAWLGCVYLNIC